ncbi:hypothetical protein ACQUFY_09480 [Robbsia andropogonis]|uniref:hypothetical protein n=1 Tax=Robbsia andropogonis TaxID=28092 RepID=UPI003D2495B7
MFSKLTASKKGELHSVGYPFEQATELPLNRTDRFANSNSPTMMAHSMFLETVPSRPIENARRTSLDVNIFKNCKKKRISLHKRLARLMHMVHRLNSLHWEMILLPN